MIREYLGIELLEDRAVLTMLPLTGVRYGWVLNGVGPISGSLKLHPLAPVGHEDEGRILEQNRMWVDATAPGKRGVIVLRDGIVSWAGVWWTRTYDPGTQEFRLGGAEWWSLARRRLIRWDVSATQVDQLQIIRDAITTAQAIGDMGIEVGAELSGRLRDLTEPTAIQGKGLGEFVEDKAALLDGFDMALEPSLENNVLTNRLRLDYPRRGRRAAQSGHTFAWGRNIVAMSWEESALEMATHIEGIGGGEGASMVRAPVSDPTAAAEGYPLMETRYLDSNVTVQATLDEAVRGELAWRSRPVELPKVTVLGDADPPLGSYVVGDDCHLVMPEGVDPRWPDGFTVPRRITAIDVDAPDEGVETVTLTMGEATAGG